MVTGMKPVEKEDLEDPITCDLNDHEIKEYHMILIHEFQQFKNNSTNEGTFLNN